MSINRSHINRCLSKAIAYHECGKQDAARAWAAELVSLLGVAAILDYPTVRSARIGAGKDFEH